MVIGRSDRTPAGRFAKTGADSSKAIEHAKSYGGGTFATLTQGQLLGLLPETCDDCHAPGAGFKSVDIVHRQK